MVLNHFKDYNSCFPGASLMKRNVHQHLIVIYIYIHCHKILSSSYLVMANFKDFKLIQGLQHMHY